MLRSSASNKSREVPGIKLRKPTAKDIPQIIAIHGAITKKKAYRRWVQQMVKDHLRKQEGVGFVAEKEGQVVGFIKRGSKCKGEGQGQASVSIGGSMLHKTAPHADTSAQRSMRIALEK